MHMSKLCSSEENKMGQTLFEKIIQAHLVEGNLKIGEDIAVRIDQTLTQMQQAQWYVSSLKQWIYPG